MLPCVSVALHEIVLAPSARFDPLGGVQVTATVPSTMSCAEASNVTGAPAGDVGSTCVLPGIRHDRRQVVVGHRHDEGSGRGVVMRVARRR